MQGYDAATSPATIFVLGKRHSGSFEEVVNLNLADFQRRGYTGIEEIVLPEPNRYGTLTRAFRYAHNGVPVVEVYLSADAGIVVILVLLLRTDEIDHDPLIEDMITAAVHSQVPLPGQDPEPFRWF